MIGNDIIDLNLAKKESNWKRKGFLAKMYTEKEQHMIWSSKNPEQMVWLLWSRKEAVYKIINRGKKIRAFNPVKIECLSDSLIQSLVKFEKEYFFTVSSISSDKIETAAVQKWRDFKNIRRIKDRALITKKENLPFYKNAAASVSDHGKYWWCIYLQTEL